MSSVRNRTMAAAVGALVIGTLLAVTASATPGSGVTGVNIATGRFVDIDTKVKTGDWKAELTTKGASDLHVIQNTIIPGGTFGWHSHPGPSLVIVKAGTATFYLASDPWTPRWCTREKGSWIRVATFTSS